MFFLLSMIPVVIGLMQLPFAQAKCYVPPSNECARLYEHNRCHGKHLKAYPGTNTYGVGSGFNDKASSVVVRAGCQLTIYQHNNLDGKSKTLGHASISYWYDLRRKAIVLGWTGFGNWNDWVSSFKCTCPWKCQCGVPNVARIVGGTEVNPKRKYPWQVGLLEPHPRPGYTYYFHCGGSIINNRWILTAAHCIVDYETTCEYNYDPNTKIVVGEHKQFHKADDVSDTKKYSIKTWIKHPGYNCVTNNYDFALLELTKSIPFTSVIRPICLPADDTKYAGWTGYVTGWGTTSHNGDSSKVLKEVQVPILANNQCGSGDREPTKMCAGGVVGKDSCQGDSGGGMYVIEKNKYVLVGVVSYGDGCGTTKPGVYARVSSVFSWITGTTQSGKKCD